MKKLFSLIISFTLSISFVTSCTSAAIDNPDANPIIPQFVSIPIAAQKKATSIIMARLAENTEKYQLSVVYSQEILDAQIQDGTFALAILPSKKAAEIYKSSNKRVKIIASITKDNKWVAVANANYLKKLPNNIAEFMQDISASISWVYSNPEDAAELAKSHKLLSVKEAKGYIAKNHLRYLDGKKMIPALNKYYKTLYSKGKLPNSAIYFVRA